MASPVSVQFRNSILTAVLIASYGCPDVRSATLPEGVWVREGYTLSIAEDSIQKPRFMAFDDKGGLFVSVPSQGKIFRCVDADKDGVYDSKTVFLEGYESGQTFKQCNTMKGPYGALT